MALQDVFTTGLNAARDVLVARAGANDPTPNNRGNNDVTAPVGAPGTLAAAVLQPRTLLLLAGLGVLVYFIARR